MNFRLKNHHLCWSWKLYSSLNVTLTYFLDQSMNFIYQEEISFFLLIFCLINGINLGWCFFFCLFTHFIWNRIYVTLTQAFYAWQLVSRVPLLADPWSHNWVGSVHEEEKPSNWPLLQGSRNQGEQEKILWCPFFGWKLGINHCSISLYHYIIKSS